MVKMLQRILLVLGVLALLAVLIDIGISIAATIPGAIPARVFHVRAGPYPLKVSLYKYPANAGYALPIAIETEPALKDTLQFDVSSLPGPQVDATPIQASFDSTGASAVRGVMEITVRGVWKLHIVIDGPAGHGVADIPVEVDAPPALPAWSGWLIGCVPLIGLLIFALLQGRKNSSISSGEGAVSTQLP